MLIAGVKQGRIPTVQLCVSASATRRLGAVDGTAGRAFLARLVATRADDPDGFYALVKGLRQQFISDHLPAGSDGQVRSVCGRLGVVAAAGELATEWGILPGERARRPTRHRSVSRHG